MSALVRPITRVPIVRWHPEATHANQILAKTPVHVRREAMANHPVSAQPVMKGSSAKHRLKSHRATLTLVKMAVHVCLNKGMATVAFVRRVIRETIAKAWAKTPVSRTHASTEGYAEMMVQGDLSAHAPTDLKANSVSRNLTDHVRPIHAKMVAPVFRTGMRRIASALPDLKVNSVSRP